MVGTFYSRSIWLLLVTTFRICFQGRSAKAIFLQVKESTYIEAAIAMVRVICVLLRATRSRASFYDHPRPRVGCSFLRSGGTLALLGSAIRRFRHKVINDARNVRRIISGYVLLDFGAGRILDDYRIRVRALWLCA